MYRGSALRAESSAVQAHLSILQGIITRMAENSRSCKLWCVTLVAAVLVLVARTGEPQHALIALAPTTLFLFLDTYYLALENAFRASYIGFIAKLHKGQLTLPDIYDVSSTGMGWKLTGRCLRSISIWLFYLLVAVTVLLAWLLIIPSATLCNLT